MEVRFEWWLTNMVFTLETSVCVHYENNCHHSFLKPFVPKFNQSKLLIYLPSLNLIQQN